MKKLLRKSNLDEQTIYAFGCGCGCSCIGCGAPCNYQCEPGLPPQYYPLSANYKQDAGYTTNTQGNISLRTATDNSRGV